MRAHPPGDVESSASAFSALCGLRTTLLQDRRFREGLLRIQPQIPQIPQIPPGVLGVLGGEFYGFAADWCLSVFVGVSRWFTLRFWSLVAAPWAAPGSISGFGPGLGAAKWKCQTGGDARNDPERPQGA